MASKLIEIADAVKTLLTTTVTNASGTISRTYTPRFKLEESSSLRVLVVPRNEDRTRAARNLIQSDHTIDVGVNKRATSDGAIDTLMGIADTIAEYLEENELPALTGARLLTVSFAPTFDFDELDEKDNFVAVIRVVYRTMRSTA